MKTRIFGPVGAFIILAILAFAYLYPGSELLFTGATDRVMSDDTDPSPLPYAYANFLKAVADHPSRAFYGAVYSDTGNPAHGAASWIPWSERALVWVFHFFVPLEQLSTAVVFALLILTGLSFYALGRAWRWPPGIALAAGIAWAFCPFERARAKVHMAMVGTYHLPLIFLGIWLITRRRDRRSLAFAAAYLLVACTTFQYFVVTAAALTPLFVLHLLWARRRSTPWGVLVTRAGVAALPALLFLTWNVTQPIPPGVDVGPAGAFPRTGEMPYGARHPFLWTYAARPLDYLVGDIALNPEPADVLPPRAWVNALVTKDLGYGNAHERTNGVRWLVIALAAFGLFMSARAYRRTGWYFLIFAAACFWLSMNPDFPAAGFGASGALNGLVAQIRVPARAGIGVHFALLALMGFTLARPPRRLRVFAWPGILPVLMILEYPPFLNPVPTAPVRPAYAFLNARPASRAPAAAATSLASDACGTGLLFPVVTDDLFPAVYYHFKQRLRGTGCALVNASTDPLVTAGLLAQFPTSHEYLQNLPQNLVVEDRLVRLASCAHLNFIAFDPVTPPDLYVHACARLGWRMHDDLTCVNLNPTPSAKDLDRACF